MIDEKNRGKGRGRSLMKLLSLLGIYANAEKVLSAHAPSKKRYQREDVIAAIATKDAVAALPAAAPTGAAPSQESGRMVAAQRQKKVNPTAKKRPELREPVPPALGGIVTHFQCKECEFTRLKPIFHKNWARHCHDYHKVGDDDDAGAMNYDGDDDGRDGADQTDDVQPEEIAKPKRYVPKRPESAAAAPVRRRRDSAGDQGTHNSRKPKGKAACKKKSKPE